MKLKTAVVLAGGAGMRLRPYTENIPKPMIEVSGKPLIHWIVEWLARNGIEKVVIGVAYMKEKVIEYFQNHDMDVEIVFSHHFLESGTGGGFKLAIRNANIKDETFLAMNGDELTDVSLENLMRFHLSQGSMVTLMAAPLNTNFGVVKIDSNNRITEFREKPLIDSVFINTGVYLFNRAIEDFLPEQGSIEKITFVELAKKRQMAAFRYYGFWRTVNTEKDLKRIEKEIELLRS
ncbi:MAG: NDP-sugar synthase [Candidatus Hodarchaeota archaeon]